jgi:hypothetical protein
VADQVLYKGNASPSIVDTIKVGGVGFSLTGSTVKLQARDPRSNTLVLNVGGAQIVQGNQGTSPGLVTYTPNTTDTAVAYQVPPLVAWWNVTLPSGAIQDTPETFHIFIRDHGQARSTDLATITEVKQALRITETARDDEIQTMISNASVMILRYVDREFAPASTATTRTFPIDITGGDLVVELNPYDLRSVTTMTLSPEGAATVLDSTMYQLEPVNNPDGTYKRVKLSPFIGGIISTNALKFGNARLAITGSWGFLVVPDDVRMACVRTVASWIDVSYGAYASNDVFGDDPRMTQARAESTFGLPLAVQRLLSTYKRMVP